MKISNTIKQLGTLTGIFTATVLISYAASSLIPTYAPGENPPSLDQAPLIYRMAGSEDPDTYLASGSSLMDIKTAVDNIGTGGGSSSKVAGGINGMVIILDGDLYATGQSLYCSLGLPNGSYYNELHKTLEDVESVSSVEYGGSGSVNVYSYIATKTDGSIWISGELVTFINNGSHLPDCAWLRVDNLPRIE